MTYFAGLYLRNFTFLAENPIYLDAASSTPRVNDQLIGHIGTIVDQVQVTQNQPYSLVIIPEIHSLIWNNPIITEENQLWELSLQSEPDASSNRDTQVEVIFDFSPENQSDWL